MTKAEMEQGFQRIWDLFAETARERKESSAEFDRRLAENERALKESSAEFDRRLAENERALKESKKIFDRELKESSAKFHQELKESREKFDRELKESGAEFDRRLAETDKLIKELRYLSERTDAKVDALSSKWGRFVEGLVIPAAERLFEERGFQVDNVYSRAKGRKSGDSMEIDVLVVGKQDVIAIEVKSTLSQDDVKEFLETLDQFKTFFQDYSNRKLFGAVAGIVIDEQAARHAYQRGLFVIGQNGDTVRILNDQRFRPKAW